MSTASASGVSGRSTQTDFTPDDRMREIGMDDFLKLMIAELQNQDPMNPMDNAQMLEQISQMREITSNDRLTDTLDSVLLGQNLSTASSLVGKTVLGLGEHSDEGDLSTWVTGKVDRVSVVDGKPVLMVGGNEISLNNISEIMPTLGEEVAPTAT